MEKLTHVNRLALAYCLACGGTGVKGGKLSGKKKCPTCKGSGGRDVAAPAHTGTVLDSFSTKENDNGIHEE